MAINLFAVTWVFSSPESGPADFHSDNGGASLDLGGRSRQCLTFWQSVPKQKRGRTLADPPPCLMVGLSIRTPDLS